MTEDIAIGIDFGTTNSCIGYWDNKEVVIIPNTAGEKTTPSVVVFKDGKSYVGEQAEGDIYGQNRVYAIKRVIGKDINNPELKEDIKRFSYQVIEGEDKISPLIKITNNGKDCVFTPEKISSLIFEKLKRDAENFLSRAIKKVVITTPAHFNDTQRKCIKSAAEKVGLEVLRIINEPTAAALSYGLGKKNCPIKQEPGGEILADDNENPYSKKDIDSYCLLRENIEQNSSGLSFIQKLSNNSLQNNIYSVNNSINMAKNILVFDLGGGTFDLTIMKMENCNYVVQSTLGDRYLGGEDFDNRLVDFCLKNFCTKMGFTYEQRQKIDKKTLARLKIACEHIKRLLSRETKLTIQVDNFINDADLIETITREQFETEICSDLFNKLMMYFPMILNQAGMNNKDIGEVLMVGGATRMPKIKKILEEKFPFSKINNNINPEEIVAYGATIQAAIILKEGQDKILKDIKLSDITNVTYGTDVMNDSQDPESKKLGYKMSVLIPKGKPTPIKVKKSYKTAFDNQNSMLVCIYQGDSLYVNQNLLLDKFELEHLPLKPAGQVEVDITFEIDINNILLVTATEKSLKITGKKEILRNSIVDSNSDDKRGKIKYSRPNREEIEDKNRLKEFCQKYKNTDDKEDKYKIINNYNDILLEIIGKFDPKKFDNDMILEKYYHYVTLLFYSFNEMLKLKEFVPSMGNIEDYILKSTLQYLEVFKNKNIYYTKSLLYIFRYSIKRSDIFYRIILEVIKNFNSIAINYLENRQKFSRYYARLYFSEAIKLFYDNIKEKEGIINHKDIYKVAEKEIKKSEQILKELDAGALVIVELTKKNGELFDPQKFISSMSMNSFKSKELGIGSGFSLQKHKFLQQAIEGYIIILDEFEKTLASLTSSPNEDNDVIDEERAICMGSIVKINFELLGRKNYKECESLLEDCIVIAKKIQKDDEENCPWFLQVTELLEKVKIKIKEEKKIFDDTWKVTWKPDLDKIKVTLDNLFKNSEINFINHILESHPPKNFDYNSFKSSFNINQCNIDLVEYLRTIYNLDQCPKKTFQELFDYSIYQIISEKLNILYEKYKV